MRSSSRRPLILALATIGVFALAGSARAQLFVSYEPTGQLTKLQVLALRPNVAQPLFFFYGHGDPGVKRNIKITLQQVDATGRIRDVGQATVAQAKQNEKVPVEFADIAPPKIPAKDDAPWPTFAGPPFALLFKIEEAKNVTELPVSILMLEPRSYVKVVDSRYDPAQRKLSIKVRWEDPQGPPCPVELDMQRSVIPGLKPTQAGTFKRTLSKENPIVELTAEKLEFDGGLPPQSGRFYLTVDGYKRAFPFKCTFSEGSLDLLKDELRARMIAARYSLPEPKTAVLLEVDSKSFEQGDDDSSQKALVELKFDRVGDGTYESVAGSPFRGLREQAIEYKFDAGALILKTKVADRVVLLNTEGINGKRSLAMRVLSAKEAPLRLADEQDEKTEKIALFDAGPGNPFAPLRFLRDKDTVLAEFVLDGTTPEGLKLLNLPPSAAPEADLVPGLRVADRSADQAPIGKVVFFAGKFIEGKIPPNAAPVDGVFDAKKKLYVAKDKIVVPVEMRGKIEISAQASTLLGRTAETTETVAIVVPSKDPGSGKDKLATITGTVRRGMAVIPNAEVFLVKAKPAKEDVPEKVKTNEAGGYTFKDVEPGKYVVVSRRNDQTSGRSEVLTVKKNEKYEKIDIELKVK